MLSRHPSILSPTSKNPHISPCILAHTSQSPGTVPPTTPSPSPQTQPFKSPVPSSEVKKNLHTSLQQPPHMNPENLRRRILVFYALQCSQAICPTTLLSLPCPMRCRFRKLVCGFPTEGEALPRRHARVREVLGRFGDGGVADLDECE